MIQINVYLQLETNGYTGEKVLNLAYDDNDDAKFQLLQNPITYRDCNSYENVNFNLEPIDQDATGETTGVSRTVNNVVSGVYSDKSDKYIRAQVPNSNKVAVSS